MKQAEIKVKLPPGIIPPSCIPSDNATEDFSPVSDTDEVEVNFKKNGKKSNQFRVAFRIIFSCILLCGYYDSIFDHALASGINLSTLLGISRCSGDIQAHQRN